MNGDLGGAPPTRAEGADAMALNGRIPRSGLALAALLVKHGVIQAEALDDPGDYDGHETLDRVCGAWEEMVSGPPTID